MTESERQYLEDAGEISTVPRSKPKMLDDGTNRPATPDPTGRRWTMDAKRIQPTREQMEADDGGITSVGGYFYGPDSPWREGTMDPTTKAICELCGEPMPLGEEMFKVHGYSGNCPKPPLPGRRIIIDAVPLLDAKAAEWLTTKHKKAADVRHGIYPHGFVQNLISRVENLEHPRPAPVVPDAAGDAELDAYKRMHKELNAERPGPDIPADVAEAAKRIVHCTERCIHPCRRLLDCPYHCHGTAEVAEFDQEQDGETLARCVSGLTPPAAPESPCVADGRGYCRTHSTCELVKQTRRILEAAMWPVVPEEPASAAFVVNRMTYDQLCNFEELPIYAMTLASFVAGLTPPAAGPKEPEGAA